MEQHNDWAAPGRRYMTLETAHTMGHPAITNSGPAGNAH
jgi:hypothetical protein